VAGRSRRRSSVFWRFLEFVKFQRHINIVFSIVFHLEFISLVSAWGLLRSVWKRDLELNRHV
jgi:hypothetical protein